MYRITAVVILGLATGCAAPNTELRDQPQIERLRIQISKARNAIAETRVAIAEARGAPHLAELYVRLAELMSDEARYHYQVAYEREQRSGKSLNVPQVRFLKLQAIGLYELALREHPKTPLAPRILFNMGQEYRELGEYKKMRTSLERLVKEHPKSPLTNEGLLILGDDRFDRNELDEASKYYSQMLTGELGPMTGLAHYKMSWVFVNKAECKLALKHFEDALVASNAWFSAKSDTGASVATSSSLDVRREALVDLVYCFTQERKGEEAIPFLKKHAYRRGAYVAALTRLADRFSTLDNAVSGAEAARELLRLAPDAEQRVDDAFMLHASVKKTKKFDQVGSDTELISRAMLRQIRKPSGAEETKDKLLTDLEAMVRDLATSAQEALKAIPKSSANYRQAARQVAMAYETHLRIFPDGEQTTAMLENLVDVLAASGDHFNAGRRAVDLAERLPKGKTKDDAWYDALVHLQTALRTVPGRMERVVARAGLRKAGAALLALELPPEKARRVKFAIARTDYDEGRYRSAIDRLNAVALEYPNTEEGNASVHLVLDSYRTLNDYLGLIRAGHRFQSADSPVAAKIKSEIAPIVKAAEQHQLDELALVAAGVDGGDVTGDLERFAETYKGSDLGERALLNAIIAARASGESATLYRLAEEIEAKYPKSKQLPAIRSTIARTAAARFELDRAVEYFEKAAEADQNNRVALYVANGRIREQLADTSGALNAFTKALRAADTPAAQDQAGAPLGLLLERLGDPKKVVSTLAPLQEQAGPELLAYLGIAQVRTGDRDNGEATLQMVIDSASGGSGEARARAFFGQAEVFWNILKTFDPGEDVEAALELVTLLDVTVEAYLKAAREGSPNYTAAAFGRLAYVSQQTATRMRTIKLPAGTPAATKAQIKQAFDVRAKRLDQQAQEALAACAEQGWIHHIFTPAVRTCLKGEVPSSDPVSYDQLKSRKATAVSANLEKERVRLTKNSEDLAAIKALGDAFMKAGDVHTARLIFARAAQIGGGPLEANLLGIACYRVGDYSGALEAFSRAAAGGLDVGRSNLEKSLRALGLGEAAKQVKTRYKGGREGGRSFNPGGA